MSTTTQPTTITPADIALSIALVRPFMDMEHEGRNGQSSVDTSAMQIKRAIADFREQSTADLQSKFTLATEALTLAQSIMDYCGGDSWEREVTAADRARFSQIYAELIPAQPPTP